MTHTLLIIEEIEKSSYLNIVEYKFYKNVTSTQQVFCSYLNIVEYKYFTKGESKWIKAGSYLNIVEYKYKNEYEKWNYGLVVI